MVRVQDIKTISVGGISPLTFHSNTARFLYILSGFGYYFLIMPYRIGMKNGQHYLHTYLPQKIICTILHLAIICGYLQLSWTTLSHRAGKLSEDPMSIFCLLRQLSPKISQIVFLYAVWIKQKGIRYLYIESLRFLDTSKKTPLSWRQRVMVAGYLFFLMISARIDVTVQAALKGDFKEHMEQANAMGIIYFPDTLQTVILGSVFHVYTRLQSVIGFYGISMFACFLTGEIGQEVAAQLSESDEGPSSVTLRDITGFYESVGSLMNAINEAVSYLMAASMVTITVFFGFLVFSFLDDPSIGPKIFSAVVVIGGMHGLMSASRGHELMNGGIREFLFKYRDSFHMRYTLGNLITLENMVNHKPLGLRAGNFPVTFGLQVTVMSTSLTYFLIMLQFLGKPSSCNILGRL